VLCDGNQRIRLGYAIGSEDRPVDSEARLTVLNFTHFLFHHPSRAVLFVLSACDSVCGGFEVCRERFEGAQESDKRFEDFRDVALREAVRVLRQGRADQVRKCCYASLGQSSAS
jgi:hypothetical protein